MRNKLIVAAVLAALAAILLALPASAHNNNDNDNNGNDNPHKTQLGVGGKLTVKLLKRGESQVLADIYADAGTGWKVKRPMRRGLFMYCHPKKFTTATFTCVEPTVAATPPVTPPATPPPTATPPVAPPTTTATPPPTATPPAAPAPATATPPTTTATPAPVTGGV